MKGKISSLYILVCGVSRKLEAVHIADWGTTSRQIQRIDTEIDVGDARITSSPELVSTKAGFAPIYLEIRGDMPELTQDHELALMSVVGEELRNKVFSRDVVSIVLTPRADGSAYLEILGEDIQGDGNVIQRRIIRGEYLEMKNIPFATLFPELQPV